MFEYLPDLTEWVELLVGALIGGFLAAAAMVFGHCRRFCPRVFSSWINGDLVDPKEPEQIQRRQVDQVSRITGGDPARLAYRLALCYDFTERGSNRPVSPAALAAQIINQVKGLENEAENQRADES